MLYKGIRKITNTTRRIEAAILKFGGQEFTSRQIADECLFGKKSAVSKTLFEKVQAGILIIVRPGERSKISTTYRHTDRQFAMKLPSAFVAEKTWSVLVVANRPLTLREIAIAAETLAGDQNLSLYSSVSRLLYCWTKRGALERTGRGYSREPFKYKMKPGITERPVTTC